MQFFGYLRVKNEARWIERVIRSLQPLCERIFVFDDHSDDGTPEICEGLGCKVYRSPFTGVNEARDKNYLLEHVWHEVNPQTRGADSQHWIVSIDGDEELEPNGPELIRQAIMPGIHALTLKIVYLWDRPDQIRTDGIYGKFTRGSVFRMCSPFHAFRATDGKANFHCGSVPKELLSQVRACNARLFHYGYLEREDRIRKYAWYNELDKNNRAEDGYRHIVQGDIPQVKASEKLRWAGPLELVPL